MTGIYVKTWAEILSSRSDGSSPMTCRSQPQQGQLVLAGSLTDAVALARGTSVTATFAHLGRVGVVGR